MGTGELSAVLAHLHRTLSAPDGGGLTDGQLLGRFVAARDEIAFEALVHRHGPMVLGVCRRVLRNAHDAEDAFQATFLLLARKAASVVKRDSVGSWLYAVAYRTAQESREANARRRTREEQVEEMPHPEVAPVEPQDWRPLLDRELTRLPEKYREAVVLYHLEGRGHREAARQLGLPEGTLSSRLVKARRLLAKRLARYGLSLSGGVLGVVLSEGAGVAAIPPPLVAETVRTAALVAAGQLAAVATPAALLTKGVLKTMFLNKLRLVLGVVVVTAVLGATGVAYRTGSSATAADKPATGRPLTELEALRKENELLKLNLEVVLEKVRTQEAELRALRGTADRTKELDRAKEKLLQQAKEAAQDRNKVNPDILKELERLKQLGALKEAEFLKWEGTNLSGAEKWLRLEKLQKNQLGDLLMPDTVKLLQDALKTLQAAPDSVEQRHAVEALKRALEKLKAQSK